MISDTELRTWHDKIGDFPLITLTFPAKLLDISITNLCEVYILLEDKETKKKVIIDVEEYFLNGPVNLNSRLVAIYSSTILSIHEGSLMQCEFGDTKWSFIKPAEDVLELVTYSIANPWSALPENRLAFRREQDIELDDGEILRYGCKIRSVCLLSSGPVVLAGDTLFFRTNPICHGLLDAQTLYVRGNTLYVIRDQKFLIFQEDAISNHSKPRIDFCL